MTNPPTTTTAAADNPAGLNGQHPHQPQGQRRPTRTRKGTRSPRAAHPAVTHRRFRKVGPDNQIAAVRTNLSDSRSAAARPATLKRTRHRQLGMIASPACGHRVQPGWDWCADNFVFGGHYPGDEKYLRWLAPRAIHVARCAFATAPDIVGDGAATLRRCAGRCR